jgi:hypothetical protein
MDAPELLLRCTGDLGPRPRGDGRTRSIFASSVNPEAGQGIGFDHTALLGEESDRSIDGDPERGEGGGLSDA